MTVDAAALGVSIDGYAVEGGYDVEGGPATSFSPAQSLGHIRPSQRSQGTFEHLGELVELAASMGFRELRLTCEWARLEPRPDVHDEVALDRYVRALEVAARASMSVVVVLCDVALPSWLGQEPWLSAWAPERFASHAARIASRLDGVADAIVTFRCPNRAAWEGWRSAGRPPHRRGAHADALSALDGMLVAHQLAMTAIEHAAPGARRAILFEASTSYDDEGLWRDLARGATDPVVLGARRARLEGLLGAAGRRRGEARGGRRRVVKSVATLRSTRRWDNAPPSEWWLAGNDVGVLCATLDHAEGTVRTVELGAGAGGWHQQLAVGIPQLRASSHPPRSVHLHGLVSSTGSLEEPRGLVGVDHSSDSWRIEPLGAELGADLEALAT